MARTCNVCNIKLHISYFGKDSTRKYGVKYICKKCMVIKTTLRGRTKVGLIHKLYEAQKHHSRVKGWDLPSYTKEEFRVWMFENTSFIDLYDVWVESGYTKKLIPSADRKDDYLPYTLSNIQLTTWAINKRRGALDRFNGINNKTNISVDQITLEGLFIATYYSMAKAARDTGLHASCIKRCCTGERKHTGGMYWRFSNKIKSLNTTLCQ